MSYMLAGRLFAAYPGGAIARDVLVALALHMSHADPARPVFPSVETVAALAGYAVRSVRAALRTLESEGWASPVGNRKGGAGNATRYRVNVEMLDAYPDRSKPTENPAPPAAFTSEKAANGDAKGGTARQKRRQTATEKAAPPAAEQGSTNKEELTGNINNTTAHARASEDSRPNLRGVSEKLETRRQRIPDCTDTRGLDQLARQWNVKCTGYESYADLRTKLFKKRDELLRGAA